MEIFYLITVLLIPLSALYLVIKIIIGIKNNWKEIKENKDEIKKGMFEDLKEIVIQFFKRPWLW